MTKNNNHIKNEDCFVVVPPSRNDGYFLRFYIILLISSWLGFASCSSNIVFEDNVTISKQQWSYEDIPSFTFRIDDARKKYSVAINFRHNKDYKFSNAFVLLHEKGWGLRDTSYRHELKLAELDGRWTGKPSGGLYHNEFLAKENFQFPDTGHYTFSIEQNMRVNPLVGVSDIGIKVFEKK